MPDRDSQIEFLRNHAARLREMATKHKTAVSPDLLKMAEAVEQRLADLEGRSHKR